MVCCKIAVDRICQLRALFSVFPQVVNGLRILFIVFIEVQCCPCPFFGHAVEHVAGDRPPWIIIGCRYILAVVDLQVQEQDFSLSLKHFSFDHHAFQMLRRYLI